MRNYTLVSATFFTLFASLQLLRALFRVPVQVRETVVPVWPSAVACVVLASLALWGFRSARAVKTN
jgi:hypothetical protein